MTKQCNIDAGNYLHWNVQKVGKWNFSKCRSVSVMTVGNTIKQSLTHDANDDTAMWKQQRHCVWLHYNVQPLLCVESNLGSQVFISHPEYSTGSYFANILFSPFQSISTYILFDIPKLEFHHEKCCNRYNWCRLSWSRYLPENCHPSSGWIIWLGKVWTGRGWGKSSELPIQAEQLNFQFVAK